MIQAWPNLRRFSFKRFTLFSDAKNQYTKPEEFEFPQQMKVHDQISLTRTQKTKTTIKKKLSCLCKSMSHYTCMTVKFTDEASGLVTHRIFSLNMTTICKVFIHSCSVAKIMRAMASCQSVSNDIHKSYWSALMI